MSDDLFKAIEAADSTTLGRLLSAGANPNSEATKGPAHTALQAAIDVLDEGSLEPIRLLLLHGAAVDQRNSRGDATPLLMAVFRRQYAVAELLLEAGADPNVRGTEGDTPLSFAASKGDVEMARLLLRHGAAKTINEPGGIPHHFTPLGAAAARSHNEMVELLLAAGSRPDAKDADGRIAIEQAEACWRLVRELLSSKSPNKR